MKNKFESHSRFLTWSIVLLLSALAAGCGGGGGSSQDPVLGTGGATLGGAIPGAPPGAILPGAVCTAAAGPTIPTVTSSNPTSGALNVTTSTTGVAGGGKLITATFSLAMAPATIISPALTFTLINNTTAGSNVAGNVTMNAANTVATFTTAAALPANNSYTAVITQAAATPGGVALSCIYAWNFTTGAVATGLAPVDPGLLAPFAISSFGGMTNAGFTKINGDVVLSPNDMCNAAVVGVANDFGANCNAGANKVTNNAGDRVITDGFPGGGVAQAVMVELLAKWNSISPAPAPGVLGATVLGCGVIGSAGGAGAGIGCAGNSTLAPGAYISATNSTINVDGMLTLDAGGNPDAVWVIQAPSALDMEVGSQILLTGGAKASNIWWFVGSSATLKTNSVFQGNILASASISMQVGATSCGRLLAGAEGAGAFTFLADTVSVPGHPNAPPVCQ